MYAEWGAMPGLILSLMQPFRLPKTNPLGPGDTELENRRPEIMEFMEAHDVDPFEIRSVEFGENSMLVVQYHNHEGTKHLCGRCGVRADGSCAGCGGSDRDAMCMLQPFEVEYRVAVVA
jgi:hypothetical protein